jgi:hypothetical protein
MLRKDWWWIRRCSGQGGGLFHLSKLRFLILKNGGKFAKTHRIIVKVK